MNFPPTLQQLWSLAEREGQRSGRRAALVFDPLGLMLFEELGELDYDPTPTNAWSFAKTGGDGVHYSLLEIEGQITDQSPVVMTVPMMPDRFNTLVGENLYEFLCLGCKTGYFWLEQLTYDWDGTIHNLLHPEIIFASAYGEDYTNDPCFQEEMRLLRLLSEEFRLSPWSDLEGRLQKLQADYSPKLIIRRWAE